MGSLILPPKAPITPPARSQTPAARVVTPSSSTSSDSATNKSSDVLSSEARSENLLRRGRGRFGTILTGFKGVLEPNKNQKRKTLLGE